MIRLEGEFRAVHYYTTLKGLEACPHAHTYTVRAESRDFGDRERFERVLKGFEGRVLNGCKILIYPEPTTENIALSIFKNLKGALWVSVREDEEVESYYDGKDIWVAVSGRSDRKTFKYAEKGNMDRKGFAADLRDVKKGALSLTGGSSL